MGALPPHPRKLLQKFDQNFNFCETDVDLNFETDVDLNLKIYVNKTQNVRMGVQGAGPLAGCGAEPHGFDLIS